MKFYIVSIFLLLSCLNNRNDPKSIHARQFYPFKNSINTTFINNITFIAKEEYFIISNYQEGDATDFFIDSFANKNKDIYFSKYDSYSMVFYKESEFTNEEYVAKNPRTIDRYSNDNDLIYRYVWDKKGLYHKAKYKNGVLINPGGIITIESIK